LITTVDMHCSYNTGQEFKVNELAFILLYHVSPDKLLVTSNGCSSSLFSSASDG